MVARDLGTTKAIPHIARLRGCAVAVKHPNVTCFLMACEMHFLELASARQVLFAEIFS